MATSFESYIREQEIAQAGKELDKVADILRAEPNKNRDCWPVYSFGWKDADLEPEGCTGIKAMIPVNDETFDVVIGGHKTVCPREEGEPDEEAEMLVCGSDYPGEWTGDDWTLHFEDQVSAKWVFTPDGGDIDYAATAEAAKEAARKGCENFHHEMKYVDGELAGNEAEPE